jgi:hypothetical protein
MLALSLTGFREKNWSKLKEDSFDIETNLHVSE